ncbi:hypothetical protein TKK_0015461 [Trichogramma kaykai]
MKSNEKVSDFCDQFDGTVKLYDESEPPAPLTEHDKASAFFRATQERCDELRKSNWIQKAMSNVGMTVHEMKCYLLQAEANKNREQPRARTTKTVMEDRCFTCDQGGHKSPDCPLKEQNKWFCYKCQSVQNHIAAKCSNHRYDDGNKNKNNDRDRDGRGRGGGKSKVGGRKDSRHRPYQKPSNNSKPKSNNKEQLIIEPKSITFEVSNEKEKENQDIEKYIEPLSREVSQPPVDKVVTTKRKETIAPRVMPKRRAKKAKLMDPDFVYRAKVPELKIDDIENSTLTKDLAFKIHAFPLKLSQDRGHREA